MSERGRASCARARPPRVGGLALGLGALVLSAAGDAEPHQDAVPCRVSGVALHVFAESRLFEAPGDRLELLAGRPLDCGSSLTRQLVAELGPALDTLAGLDGSSEATVEAAAGAAREHHVERSRFGEPLRVHLDPALPRRQAPLTGVEVHVGRRELLVARSALGALGQEAWRHELLHVIAAPPPDIASPARRLWLTLEEGLVAHVERASTHAGRTALPSVAVEPSTLSASVLARRALPAAALLADPAYDPHPLAAGLTRELGGAEPVVALGAWMDCLAARPPELPVGATAPDVFQAFVARCSPASARALSDAIGRWWVEAESPAALARARKAAARAGDSR